MDLSENLLTESVANFISDAVRGLFENGIKITDSKLKRILINDNPTIGSKGAKILVKGLANDVIEHLELRNIGAKPGILYY